MSDYSGMKVFDKAFNGYKIDAVDEYVREMSEEIMTLRGENDDLEKKLEVLADKIREYRKDEDALKEALLGAQKQGNAIMAQAKENAEDLTRETQEKIDNMIKAGDDEVAARKAEAAKIIADAKAEKARIEAEAEAEKNRIHSEMVAQNEKDTEILARTRKEAEDFTTRIIFEFTNKMDEIKKIPQSCDNEYVVKTVSEHEKKKAENLLEIQKTVLAPEIIKEATEITPEVDGDEEEEAEVTEQKGKPDFAADATTEVPFVPEFDDEDSEEAEENGEEAGGPFFNKKQHKSSYEKLQFGANDNKKKK